MKNNKIIIYDDNCPLCAAYTRGFVSAGMIQKENRMNFTTIDPGLLKIVDIKRCVNEIPVIDSETKEVWYGIEGIVEILHSKIPFIKKIMEIKPVNWILHKLYNFISYNRRVIIATNAKPGNFDCTPDFNFKYRLAFLFIFLIFNTWILLPINRYLLQNSFIAVSTGQLMLAHIILVGMNIIIAAFLKQEKALEYLGQINMLALETALLTVPFILMNKYHILDSYFLNNIYILVLIVFVFKEYFRRLDFAGIVGKYDSILAINILGIAGFILYLAY